MALGAIFATTDSVAVLQVLEQDRAPLLFNLVFGEGVINDATTVALLRTVQVDRPSSQATYSGCCFLVYYGLAHKQPSTGTTGCIIIAASGSRCTRNLSAALAFEPEQHVSTAADNMISTQPDLS